MAHLKQRIWAGEIIHRTEEHAFMWEVWIHSWHMILQYYQEWTPSTNLRVVPENCWVWLKNQNSQNYNDDDDNQSNKLSV